MTGKEAWSIVAPILASHGGTRANGLDCMDEAYVLIYSALKYWDENKDEKREKI